MRTCLNKRGIEYERSMKTLNRGNMLEGQNPKKARHLTELEGGCCVRTRVNERGRLMPRQKPLDGQ